MVSGSLIPGIGVHLFTTDGMLIKNNSNVLLSLVGKLMVWLNPVTIFKRRKLSHMSLGYSCFHLW